MWPRPMDPGHKCRDDGPIMTERDFETCRPGSVFMTDFFRVAVIASTEDARQSKGKNGLLRVARPDVIETQWRSWFFAIAARSFGTLLRNMSR